LSVGKRREKEEQAVRPSLSELKTIGLWKNAFLTGYITLGVG
jgi:hypothetical protein